MGVGGHPPAAWAQNAKIDALNQTVSQWLQNPDDEALGKTVVKQAKAFKGAANPKEYNHHKAMGQMAFKDAKSQEDFEDAVSELKSATEAAPWIADGWYNLGMAKKMAKDYSGAVNDLNLYLLLSPKAKDAEKVQNTIYTIEYAAKKAVKEEKAEKETMSSFAGEWCPTDSKDSDRCLSDSWHPTHMVITESGGEYSIVTRNISTGATDETSTIDSVQVNGNHLGCADHEKRGYDIQFSFTLTSDGKYIEGSYQDEGRTIGVYYVRVK